MIIIPIKATLISVEENQDYQQGKEYREKLSYNGEIQSFANSRERKDKNPLSELW